MIRTDRRAPMETRPCVIQPGFVETAAGSCLISTGKTRVICTASVEESVPPFLRDKGQGWVTAEYAMLPASTGRRKARDGIKKDGRSVEIQRLIGRSLRQAVDMTKLGERTITLDCDVLTADGGTRTASITGAYVALVMAVDKLMKDGLLSENPIISQVAAVSAGIVEDEPLLDLCYVEDSRAQTDMNFVMNHRGEFIELQGTGEGRAYTRGELNALLDLHLQTGEISRIERGKHTTRHAQLIETGGLRVMDTPGFSLLEFDQVMNPVELMDYYPEFQPYQGCCRFQPCYHGSEPGCAVIQAAREGKISPARLERYHELLEKTRQLWRERYD